MTDIELLDRWRDGDSTAGDALLQRHFDSLCTFFANKVGDECEELVQRSLLACIEKRDQFREASSFRTFLFGIARFELYNHFRSCRVAGRWGVFSETSAYDLSPTPSQIVAARAEQRILLDALRRIPLDLQVALELRYWEQLRTGEMAEVLGVPVGTVKSRLRRGKEKLEEILGTSTSTTHHPC